MNLNHQVAEYPVRRPAWLVAILSGAAVFIRDSILFGIFSYSVQQDTPNYLQLDAPFRSLPYPLLNVILNSIYNPSAIVLLQIVIAAVAVASLVYVLARMNFGLAALIAVLFILDVTWSATNLVVLTESIFVSFHVICLACFLLHYRRRAILTRSELLVAGILYGWTFTIRPSGLLLILPTALAYFLFTRSWPRTAFLLSGFSLFLFFTASLNFLIYQQFTVLGRGGIYASFPLYAHHLYSPENGPYSQQIDPINKSCIPDLDYNQINAINITDYLWRRLVPCWSARPEGNSAYSTLHLGAYVEAIRRYPIQYMNAMLRDSGFSLSFPVHLFGFGMAEGIGENDCNQFPYAWCPEGNQRAMLYPDLKAQLYLLLRTVGVITFPFKQTYLAIAFLITGVKAPGGVYYIWGPFNLLANVLWFVTAVVTILATRGAVRILVIACFVFVLYTVLTVATGNVFAPRYSVPLGPAHIILSSVGLWLIYKNTVQRFLHYTTLNHS